MSRLYMYCMGDEDLKPELRAGAARIDISPPPGVDLTGFIARNGPNIGVHDPVCARALALEDGITRVLLIACDLLGLEAGTVAAIRCAIETATGIPAAHIMITCSHTHAGPACMMLRDGSTVDCGWLAALPQKLSTVAQNAVASLRTAKLAAGATNVDGISRNRRCTDGPLDTTLHLLRVTSLDDEPIAALVNFACHPVTTGPANRLVSADFPGVVCAGIEAEIGGIALFLNGASADVNPVTPSPFLDCRDGDFETVENNGRALAAAALERWNLLQPVAARSLRARSLQLQLPLLPPPSVEELKERASEYYAAMVGAMQSGDNNAWRFSTALLQWAMATLKEYRLGAVRRSVEAEVQVLSAGDIALVGVPGELFTALGQSIRCDSPAAHTFIATCTNGNIGYIAPREEYSNGGYEVDDAYHYYDYPSALAPEAGEAIVQAARELLNEQGI
jgi:hypothetical protein